MEKHYGVAVIGGGAAGFAAAITAAENGAKAVILEGGGRTGRKLSASGNGQGNIANASVSALNYNCELPLTVFEKVPYREVEKFFERAGIATVQKEGGRIYPLGMQASGVTDNLRLRANELNTDEVCGFAVNKIERKGNRFYIYSQSGAVSADSVIIACGGRAHPNLSCGGGYFLLEALGHKLTELSPALVQLKSDKAGYLRHLKGIRLENASVYAVSEGRTLKQAEGDVIFADYGVTGSAVFEVSGYAVKALNGGGNVNLKIDVFSNTSVSRLINILHTRKNTLKKRSVSDFLTGFTRKQLAKAVFEYAEIDTDKQTEQLSDKDIGLIAQTLKGFNVTITGSLGFEYAQVTAGGIEVSGFDGNLMSKLCKNLYACGEILDVHGDCGGYNLLWAFSSGILCGREAAKSACQNTF